MNKRAFALTMKSNALAGFPDRIRVNMKGEFWANYTGVAPVPVQFLYLYWSPNYFSTGQSALYNTTYATIYRRYMPISSSLKVKAFVQNTTQDMAGQNPNVFVGIVPQTNNAAATTSLLDVIKQPRIKWQIGNAYKPMSITNKASVKQVHGLDMLVNNQEQYTSSSSGTSVPVTPTFWGIYYSSIDSTVPFDINFLISVNIYAEYYARVPNTRL